jgi:NAD+ synthase (glutamine-hydrolysing)
MSQIKIILAQINPHVGHIDYNLKKIYQTIDTASADPALDLIIFPELALSGYSPEDLLLRQDFLAEIETALLQIAQYKPDIYILIGHPKKTDQGLYNAASVLHQGKIIETYYKQKLPNYAIFDEKRYFIPGNQTKTINIKNIQCGILICEDIWFPEAALAAQKAGAEILLIINASPFEKNKAERRIENLKERQSETGLPLVYVNLIGGQDELVFDGGSVILDEKGEIVAEADYFVEDLLGVAIENSPPEEGCPKGGVVDTKIKLTKISQFNQPPRQPGGCHPSSGGEFKNNTQSIYSALVLGVRDYLAKNNFKGALLGLSGGIDSALALCIAVDAIGAENVEAIMMPSQYTSQLSYDAAKEQADKLNVKYQIISIKNLYENFINILGSNVSKEPNKMHENLQARCRGILLMALSNQTGKIVLTTGNKSEMAVGYATLYGDMCGGFNPLKDVLKTEVYELAKYRNSLSAVIPEIVIERPPSAELAPNQTDQDTLPPYPILDAILKSYIEENKSIEEIVDKGFEIETVDKIIRMLKFNEYKRRQSAPGVRISKRAFGKDWRMPIS